MCGIAGIVHFSGEPVEQADLKKMTDAVAHRGPDGEGYFTTDRVGLGHRRLAIIDLNETASQPLHGFDSVLVFNGEIYNYLELKEELRILGYHFQTNSDSEVILAAYHAWGCECVSRFCGMWAFALYDTIRKELMLSRDRFGKKPLYYHVSEKSLWFCSEIKGLLTQKAIRPFANQQVMATFLLSGEVETDAQTFFAGIHKLPAGHSMQIQPAKGTYTITKNYKPDVQVDSNIGLDEAVQLVQTQLKRSIIWRMRSDVPVGISLSGGLDSTAVAVLAKRESALAMSAYTTSARGAKSDEADKAKAIAELVGLNWQATEISFEHFSALFWQAVWCQEEPFDTPSVLMQHATMQLAAEGRAKVLLSGQGADEVFSGYLPHIPAWVQQMPAWQRPGLWLRFARNSQLTGPELARLPFFYQAWRLRQKNNEKRWKDVVQPNWLEAAAMMEETQLGICLRQEGFNAYMQYQVARHGLPKLLRYEDKNAMHFGIETRLPYMDHQLVETVWQIPYSWRMANGWTKFLLRRAMQDALPAKVVWQRRKIGYEAPVHQWLHQREKWDELIQRSPLLQSFFHKLDATQWTGGPYWRMLSVAAWEHKYLT